MPEPDVLTAVGISKAVKSGGVSAVEVAQYYLNRIERSNPLLKAFVYLDPKGALEAARKVDERIRQGDDPGVLAGVPLGVKDLVDCAGMPSQHGSVLHRGRPPETGDSPHVARARRAGVVLFGKTATPEFGVHSITASPACGVTRNPWNLQMSPGGSSGGSSAAVASGMVPIATGTDGGGSIRSPAAFTGLVGLKPSHGRAGLVAANDTTVVGCLSNNVRDTARFLDVIAGPVSTDRTSLPLGETLFEEAIETLGVAGLRATWSDDFGFIASEQECVDVARRAAETLVRAGKLRWIDRAFRIANTWEAYRVYSAIYLRGDLEFEGIWPSQIDRVSARVRERASAAESLRFVDLVRAERLRSQIEAETARLFDDVDVLFSPATAVVSLPADGPIPEHVPGSDVPLIHPEAHLQLANLCWLPAISVPAGLSKSGLPIGLQIVCPRWRDDIALRLARIMEVTQPWPRLAPASAGIANEEIM